MQNYIRKSQMVKYYNNSAPMKYLGSGEGHLQSECRQRREEALKRTQNELTLTGAKKRRSQSRRLRVPA